MNTQEMIDLCKRHTMYTWSAGKDVSPLPVSRAEGVYFYTPEGQRFLDFNSQLMSVLIGHGHPKVIAAMKKQLDELIFVNPQTATEPRARLGKLLSEIVPGNINSFFFALGGAEANENAVRAARVYSKRFKILTRYRSYHGGTNLTLQLTGDPRRWPAEPGSPGVVHVMDPRPYNFSFGKTDEEINDRYFTYLEEIIQYENPKDIAAMMVETVTGTNGLLVPPKGWFPRLRALLDKYGILLICDEVMAGMGRTGKMMAFEHFDVVPDICTMAKGLTSSYFPLGAMGVSDPIHEYFTKNTFPGGLTYNSHPLGLATAEAVIRVMIDEKMVENAARMGELVRAEFDKLKRKHPSFGEGRCIGLFAMADVVKNSKGELLVPYNGSHPAMSKLGQFFRKEGLFSFVHWSNFTCNPPLCITEAQLKDGFEIIDRGLAITDEAFEG
ncbi:MAG TPA: aminotransferase class III-fold pyridoxal phosphate-dependent enzyme [Myxococcales bacterium]